MPSLDVCMRVCSKVYDGTGDYDAMKQSKFYYVDAFIMYKYSSVLTFTVKVKVKLSLSLTN
jgi:hypothetical protein